MRESQRGAKSEQDSKLTKGHFLKLLAIAHKYGRVRAESKAGGRGGGHLRSTRCTSSASFT